VLAWILYIEIGLFAHAQGLNLKRFVNLLNRGLREKSEGELA